MLAELLDDLAALPEAEKKAVIATAVKAAFSDQTVKDPASGTPVHQVDIHRVVSELRTEQDAERRLTTSQVTITGRAARYSGTTFTDDLTDPA